MAANRRARGAVLLIALAGLLVPGLAAARRLEETPHNFTATGPGVVKDPTTRDPCKFCHTPHRAALQRGLWNRDLPATVYELYGSTTLVTRTLGQPTGPSRLCLSCHDGTMALSAVRVRPRGARTVLQPLTGRASLGTDLSDDHPVSFVYDAELAQRQGELADPTTVTERTPLDRADRTGKPVTTEREGRIECTTCHDPHGNPYRKFLRVDDRGGALCTECHRIRDWGRSVHATARAEWKGTGANPWPGTDFKTTADQACLNCHRSHAAPRPSRLLGQAEERQVCLVCHNGNVAARDVEGDFARPSAHPVRETNWVHEPLEDPVTMPRHVTCVDCHPPHQTGLDRATPPAAPGRIRGVRGVGLGGTVVARAQNEYEVCFKCHGLSEPPPGREAVRQDPVRNIRLLVAPGNSSYHPIAARARQRSPSLVTSTVRPGQLIYCGDCHGAGDGRSRAPHGSQFAPILSGRYVVTDPGSGVTSDYALCFGCHSETALYASAFPHRLHVVAARASCAACHDAHGSRRYAALVNFMLRAPAGNAVVSPAPSGRLEFASSGGGQGLCYLACHGKSHDPLGYGGGPTISSDGGPRVPPRRR